MALNGTEVTSHGCDTVPKLFMKVSAERGDRIAMREKDFGIWQSYSWSDYREYALAIANGLLSLGLQRGDVISIQSEDCKEWLFADLGGLLAGGVVNGVYPTYQSRQVEHALTDSSCRFLFVEDEEQLDKFLEIEDRMPDVEKVFVFDWKGLRGFEHEKVAPVEDLYEAGRAYSKQHPDRVDRIVADSRPDDLAILIYTSGTTGMPKGSMISQRYIMFQINLTPDTIRQKEDDELLTYLPLCHVAERIFSAWAPLATGATINFAESPETVAQDLVELSPTYMFAVPRVLEKFYSKVTTAMSEATWIGRKTFELAMRVGMRRADALLAGESQTTVNKVMFQIADRVVFRNIKKLLGLDRVHGLVSGAAPISTALLKWYLAMGIPVDEAYGQTEAGVVTATRKGVFRLGTVGPAAAGVDIRISDAGEVLLRSQGNFSGYLNQPEKTAETLVDGWVRTGDVGELDEEGNLSITDRLKDIIITAGGKNITPSVMENELKFSLYISDAVIIGDKRKYLTCLIMIDQENVEHYAQTHAIPFTDYKSLCANKDIVALIDGEVARVNEEFSSVETVKKFRLIDVLLTAEDDELTPTMKLKRSFINEKYSNLIESMYGA
ncbi:MAG: AMP-binding protein [Gammaproteobacteria bacterium]|jgi:long-chain acyl-CoA synthetase|nr:AMP-binding protein [Gammaproteobacteria bacterium]